MPQIFLFKKKKKNSTFLLFQGRKGEQFNDIVALQKVFQMTRPCMRLDWFHTRRSLTGAGAPQCPALPPPLGRAEPTPCCPALESKVLFPSPKSWAGLFQMLARAVRGPEEGEMAGDTASVPWTQRQLSTLLQINICHFHGRVLITQGCCLFVCLFIYGPISRYICIESWKKKKCLLRIE